MKKILTILTILFVVSVWGISLVKAQEPITLYFFYGDGCPHCAKEEKFLDQLEKESKNIVIRRYEVWKNKENADLMAKIASELDISRLGVPFLVIGDKSVVGYYSPETTGNKIKSIIEDYSVNSCSDIVAPLMQNNTTPTQCIHGCDHGDEECMHNCGCEADYTEQKIPETINIPLAGEIKVKDFSLPLLTIIIAAIDGFNPCAMWVLLFLISLLLGMQDKVKMWTLGSTFILASATAYFLFLSAWLNLFLFLGFVFWIRVVIGLVALGSGGYHLYDYYKSRGCVVENNEKRKKMFNRIRGIILEKKFWVAVIGIVLLAFAVNLVELVCSAGLPAVYTQVLSLSNLPAWKYYAYLILYIFIFMLDDLLVFVIAMATLQMKAISSRYTRYSALIGGIIMLIVGILLIFKPGWLMFG